MSILEKLKDTNSVFSLEFFPPKKDMPISSVYDAISKLSAYNPAFVSVTYGAGGGNRERTIDIASYIKNTYDLEAIAHLTCVGADQSSINGVLTALEQNGIKDVLALRGDVPEGMDHAAAFTYYQHASDLIEDIKKRGGYTVAAAAYPEGHLESPSISQDITYMRLKEDAGADFFVTQLCFSRTAIIDFYDKVGKADIKAPVITGIMPVINPNQIIRMAFLSACSIPASLSRIISKYGDNNEDFRKAGLEYAVEQINSLLDNGIKAFHLYTMNKSDAVEQIITDSNLTY